MGADRFRPQFATALGFGPPWFFDRPQQVFGPVGFTPPPPVTDIELVEETTGVFQDLIYNETGSGDDGNIAVTQT